MLVKGECTQITEKILLWRKLNCIANAWTVQSAILYTALVRHSHASDKRTAFSTLARSRPNQYNSLMCICTNRNRHLYSCIMVCTWIYMCMDYVLFWWLFEAEGHTLIVYTGTLHCPKRVRAYTTKNLSDVLSHTGKFYTVNIMPDQHYSDILHSVLKSSRTCFTACNYRFRYAYTCSTSIYRPMFSIPAGSVCIRMYI